MNTIRVDEHSKYSKVGNHPLNKKHTSSLTVSELSRSVADGGRRELKKIFYNRGDVSYLYALEDDRGVLFSLNSGKRWEIYTMKLRRPAA